uniref:Cyclic phosphodiesterase n=1 Tax=Chlamydomonas euryale TaxID=1486919 RepID=A0A7R9V3H9_9CHLO
MGRPRSPHAEVPTVSGRSEALGWWLLCGLVAATAGLALLTGLPRQAPLRRPAGAAALFSRASTVAPRAHTSETTAGGMDKSYLRAGLEESYSIWAMPRGTQADLLQQEIDAQRAAHRGAPFFPPHVTMLAGIKLSGEEVLERAKALARQLPPYYILFDQVARGEIYFQCVYLLCKKDEDTMAAGALARTIYDLPTPPYMPHLSLLYSHTSEEKREAAVLAARERLYGDEAGVALPQNGFHVDSLTIWYTPGEDESCLSWVMLAELPLTGRV